MVRKTSSFLILWLWTMFGIGCTNNNSQINGSEIPLPAQQLHENDSNAAALSNTPTIEQAPYSTDYSEEDIPTEMETLVAPNIPKTERNAQAPNNAQGEAAMTDTAILPERESGGLLSDQSADVLYNDPTYEFEISYPADFIFRALYEDELTMLVPTPVAAFLWMNPTTAASDFVELEPADIELRVFQKDRSLLLEDWIVQAGIYFSGGSMPNESLKLAKASGIKVCSTSMVIPNCSIFVDGANGWVYQLIPITIDGEIMTDSFSVHQ